MLVKTRGIVLGNTKYGETSIIAHIYTQMLGRQSYMVNSVRTSKKKNMLALLQPLTILDMEVYHKNKGNLHRIKEIKVSTPFTSIPFNPVRRSIALFTTELLSKTLREESPNEPLFQFLTQSIQALDEGIPGEYNFHLFFMLQLTRFLGFSPHTGSPAPYFDLTSGSYCPAQPHHNHYITGSDLLVWNTLIESSLIELSTLNWNSAIRQQLISLLESYYQLHLPGFGHLNSHHVLHQLF